MLTRTTYILFLMLAGTVLFSLDRIQTSIHARQQHVRLNRLSVDLSREFEGFFATRLDALKAMRFAFERSPAADQTQRFAAVASELFGKLRGTRGVTLLNADCKPLTEWTRGEATIKHGLFDGRQDLFTELSAEALGQRATVASNALPLPDGDFSVLTLAPLDNPKPSGPHFVAAEFRICRPTQASFQLDELSDCFVVLKDHTGTPLLSDKLLPRDELGRRGYFPVADKRWSLYLHDEPADISAAFVARTTVWGLGIVLIITCAVFGLVLSEKNAVLADTNRGLAKQMDTSADANRKLLEANQELDDFTYVVAHDLKEPLRGIETLTAMLLAEHADSLNDTAGEYLNFIKRSGVRMHRLVNDLLRLSRISRRHYPSEQVDFNELVTEVTDSLRVAIDSARATVTLAGELPTLTCDRVRTAELFQNLLGNALKFINGCAPVIEVGCERRDEKYCFWVKDNGIGIPAADQTRIFQIFQRARTAEDTEGTGVGLTICKRIVEHHQGRIWIDSEPGNGCTVFFTLSEPSAPSAPEEASHG